MDTVLIFFREADDKTKRTQGDVSKRLGERVRDINFWKNELNNETDNMITETNQLLEVSNSCGNNETDSKITETSQLFKVSNSCGNSETDNMITGTSQQLEVSDSCGNNETGNISRQGPVNYLNK